MSEAASSSTPPAPPPNPPDPKVKIYLMPVGSAPILKRSKFKVSASSPWSQLVMFVRKQLALAPDASLHLYLGSAFSPNMDEQVGGLSECFRVGEELQVQYSIQEAWG
ncbi:hypothetical protein TL16_g03823 [Triparma laevis f. inornata]|uniref:Ubiquitin-like protein ATG12 n=2 Tax=Triparma laevis TaxID=1534972 RepID=A0A9W7F9S0_9STRA|nr:hypothetical protein TL16_g03823 [Triparma laevis f. inornata]GMI07946.1 hypothetical protein TrLO_g71 [Triparma laevis f. longispina]